MNTLIEHGNTISFSFWYSWPGTASLVILCGASLHNIFSGCIDDDIFDRFYYWSIVVASGAALLHVYYGSDPRAIMKVLIVGLAIRFAISVIQKRLRFYKNGKAQKTFNREK